MAGKRTLWIGVLVVAAIAALAFWLLPRPLAYANIATGYAAQQTCACLHVAGRSLDSCMGDFPADARQQLKITQNGNVVHASALGLFKADAEYDGNYGCRLLN
ncbi:MAG TPA: hypothetical protein VG943_00705 [Caulobacterales bacterium]|nr:hypothetical protein [Caulobacterales bacterium]